MKSAPCAVMLAQAVQQCSCSNITDPASSSVQSRKAIHSECVFMLLMKTGWCCRSCSWQVSNAWHLQSTRAVEAHTADAFLVDRLKDCAVHKT